MGKGTDLEVGQVSVCEEDAAVKETRMCHPYHTQAVSSPAEQERLLAMGWVFAAGKPKSNRAVAVRQLHHQRRDAGWRRLNVWLSPEQIALLLSVRLPGESYSALFCRLAEAVSCHVKGKEQTDN